MDYRDLLVEKQIAEAMQRGEFEITTGKGKPLDLDQSRQPGWWAERLARSERSKLLREDAVAERSATAATLWRAPSIDALHAQVAVANKRIADWNARLEPEDALPLHDVGTVEAQWHAARPKAPAPPPVKPSWWQRWRARRSD